MLEVCVIVCTFLIVIVIILLKIRSDLLKDLQSTISALSVLDSPYRKKGHKAANFRLQPLRDAFKDLETRLERKDKQRRQYAARLKLQNRQNTEVIEAIGHEFKNPVASIMGYAQTLTEDPNIDKKVGAKFLDKIYQNANNISQMIDRLALAAKLESNMLTPVLSCIELKQLLEDVKHQIIGKYKKAQIEIVCADNCNINADKTMLSIILTNLLDNACKYGGQDVFINVARYGSMANIAVSDKGQGISKQDLEYLTQKFYRVRQNGWDNSLGLGLAIVDYLLKLHHSKLDIESKVGIGSKFSFEIELVR